MEVIIGLMEQHNNRFVVLLTFSVKLYQEKQVQILFKADRHLTISLNPNSHWKGGNMM